MNNLSTNQKIVIGVGAAATLGAAVAALLIMRSRKEEEIDKDEPASVSQTKEETKEPVDEKVDLAEKLRAAGNKAFTEKNYDEAIRLYTEALELSDTNSHLLYSNRSAAFLFKGDQEQAINDAEQCLKIKPDWSKGYFRLGKALMALKKYDDAFKHFYKGTLIDKSSDELKILLEQCSVYLGIGEMDSRAHVEKEMVKLFSREQCEAVCNNELNLPYETVRDIVEKAIQNNSLSTLLEDSVLESSLDEHAMDTYRILAEILVDLDRSEEAYGYAAKAFQAKPTDPTLLLLLVTSMLRNASEPNSYLQAFEHMRAALRLAPKNVQIIHTYASLLLQITSINNPLPAPVKTLLSELKVGLDAQEANHLLVADSGMRLWFKLLEEHTDELIAEENRNSQNKTPPDEAYIYGLTKGAFSKICLEPFFQQALSQVVFSNPGLETVLAPFRSAFTSLKRDEDYNQLAPFIYALALQCYRNNYSWPASVEDKKRLDSFLNAAHQKVQAQGESLVKDGQVDPELLYWLSLISLFQPLYTVSGLASVLASADLTKMHQWLSQVIKKTLLDHVEEEKIKESLTVLTPVLTSDSLIAFYDHHVPVWDSAGLAAGRLTTVTVKQELSWVFRKYQPKGFDGPVKTLIAGCGSGSEVYQNATFYKDMEITAVDFSANSLAFAVRQHKDLGITNINFCLADVQQLDISQFSEPFDLVIANGLIHHLNDPLKGWEKLAGLLRSGGLLRMSLYSGRFVELLQKTRDFLNKAQSPPLFTEEKPFPRLKRQPTIDEIRDARQKILSCQEGDLEELRDLVTSPQFYALNEFADLVFHNQVQGFSFDIIGNCINKLGLKLIGFEFPGLTQEKLLKYRVEYPNDPDMINPNNLEKFSKKYPDAFKNFTHTINFIVEKP